MDTQKVIAWVRTTGLAAVGGGIAGAFAAAMDPTKYSIAQDLGSGKLWKYFFMGAALTFGGALLKSPLGQQTMAAFRDSQKQLEQNKADLAAVKEELKAKSPVAETKAEVKEAANPSKP